VQVGDMGVDGRIFPVSSSAAPRKQQPGELGLKERWYLCTESKVGGCLSLAVSTKRTFGPGFWFTEPFLSIKGWFLNTKGCVRSIKNWFLNTKNRVHSIKNRFLNTKNRVRSIKNRIFNTKKRVRSIKNRFLNTKKSFHSIKNWFLNTKKCVRSIKNRFLNTKKHVRSIKKCLRIILEMPFSLVFMGFSSGGLRFAPWPEKVFKKYEILFKPEKRLPNNSIT
jgi:hypothetical protein